jgi:hypothetical protein
MVRNQHRVFSSSCSRMSDNFLTVSNANYMHSFRPRRRVVDRFTWMIPFDTTDVTKSDTPTFVLENSWFGIQGLPYASGSSQIYCIRPMSFTSCVLKWAYCSAASDDFWHGYVRPRLNDLTIEEIMKLPKESRPARFRDLIARSQYACLEAFKKPEAWTYYDHMIPVWAKEWEELNPTVDDLHGWIC